MTLDHEQKSRPSTLGRFLLDAGSLTPDWAPAFEAVPRSLFLPDLVWAHDMATGASRAIDRAEDQAAWLDAADANVPIVTQWDDGRHSGTEPGHVPTSSASMPSVVAEMLRDLDVRPGMSVLEVGTGTGWNAGLLAHRLGAENVTSIEVDGAVADEARKRLAAAGLNPTVVTGDGAVGFPGRAPYDRVIVTAGLRSIPAPLLQQIRPGGMLLAPWGTHFAHLDALVQLTVHQDGTASGPFLRPVEFMKLRAQRLVPPQHPQDFPGDATTTVTTVRPPLGTWEPFPFAAGLLLRDVTHVTDRHGGDTAVWLYGLTDNSWSAVVFRDGATESTVYQSGPRRLWDELEDAYGWWEQQGRPGFNRFGLTVTPDGQRAWLDDPGQPLPT